MTKTSLMASLLAGASSFAPSFIGSRRTSVEAGNVRKDGDGKRKKVAKNTYYNPNKRPHNIRGERLVINHRK